MPPMECVRTGRGVWMLPMECVWTGREVWMPPMIISFETWTRGGGRGTELKL